MSIDNQSNPPTTPSEEGPSKMEPQTSFRPAASPSAQTSSAPAAKHSTASAPGVIEQARSAMQDAQAAATSFAGEMKEKLTEQVSSQATEQVKMAADRVDQVADAVRGTAGNFSGREEWLAGLITQGADELAQLSKMLRTNDLRALLGHVEDFAKRQPSLFAGAALAAGFAAVRIAKASKSQGGASSAGSTFSNIANTVSNTLHSATTPTGQSTMPSSPSPGAFGSDMSAISKDVSSGSPVTGSPASGAATTGAPFAAPTSKGTFESPDGGATVAGNPPSTTPGAATPRRGL